jgi:ferredoxin
MQMARHGLVWFDREGGEPRFRLAPFVVGVYEAQLERMDHEFAHLVEHYLAGGGAAGIMRPQPALTRVVPARGAVRAERILPYDDVRRIIEDAERFRVIDCICRTQQDHIGRSCDFPLRMCLVLSSRGGPPGQDDVSREEALAVLDRAEGIGLVHSASNVMEGMEFVCNCCGCCCAILRCINEWGIERSVACSNYYAIIDPDECEGCGACIDRCQVHAIQDLDGVSVVDRVRCIGCGLCVTGCPEDAAKLQVKPDAEMVHPPLDYAAWERERLANRSAEG